MYLHIGALGSVLIIEKALYRHNTSFTPYIKMLTRLPWCRRQVSVRVMNMEKFMNSKVLFKDVRHRPAHQRAWRPVMVHINYHPDKHARMQAVFKYYAGDNHALDPFPGGSQPGT